MEEAVLAKVYYRTCTQRAGVKEEKRSFNMNPEKFRLPQKFWPCEENVWMEYADMARKYKPLNLGQGAPDYTAPKILSDALEEVSKIDDPLFHQYTRGFGHPRLANVLSKVYSPLLRKEIDPLDEILIANGATEALYCAVIGFINEGDEVILMEPYFDHYNFIIQMAGGTARYIPLIPKENASSSSDWVFDLAQLQSLFNSKTKMIIVNTPHNPTGKVYTAEELQQIADLCIKWDVMCISDEVYEWMTYKPSQHLRIGALPDMWCRTITVGSAGKTFSATGWKIGWAFGPSGLLHNLRIIHQNCVYTCCSPLQEALARAFEREEKILGTPSSYFTDLVDNLVKKRDFMADLLKEVGMKPMVPDGGYFILADWSLLASKADLDSETDKYKDYRFTKWMSKNLGLQVIPLSAFYSEPNKHLGENFVRFCFIKQDKNLEKAAQILKTWKRID